jgi:hypothetical protein
MLDIREFDLFDLPGRQILLNLPLPGRQILLNLPKSAFKVSPQSLFASIA